MFLMRFFLQSMMMLDREMLSFEIEKAYSPIEIEFNPMLSIVSCEGDIVTIKDFNGSRYSFAKVKEGYLCLG